MAALGSLVVSLGLDAAEFTNGLTKAQFQAKKFVDEIGANLSRAATAATALGAAVAGGVLAIDKVAGSIAKYQDLADQIGSTASAVSSLQLAADQSETSLNTVASASVRLTQTLSKVDDESDAAARALKSIGLSFNEFRKLDPVKQLEQVAQQFAKFENGAGKTAAAVALFGKAGAELIPFLNDLAEAQGRSITLTDEQIRQADQFNKDIATLKSEFSSLVRVMVADLLPTFQALLDVFKDAGQSSGAFSAVGDAIRTVFETLTILGANVVFVFKGVGREIGAIAAQIAALATLDIRGFRAISEAVKEDARRARAELDAFERRVLNAQESARQIAINNRIQSDPRELARRGRPTQQVDFQAAKVVSGAKKAKEEIDKVAEAINALEQELALFGQDDSFAKAFKLEGLGATTEQLAAYRDGLYRLKELRVEEDIKKATDALIQERDAVGLTANELKIQQLVLMGASQAQIEYATSILKATDAAREQIEIQADIKRLNEELATPLEKLIATYDRLNKALANGLSPEVYARGVAKAQEEFQRATEIVDKNAEKTNDIANQLGMTFSSAFEDAIVGGKKFSEVLKGLYEDILRIVTRKLVTEPLANMLTSALGGLGGSGGGIFSGLLSGLFGRALGGPVEAGGLYRVNERRPEVLDVNGKQFLMMGNQRGRVLNNPQMQGRQTSIVQNFHLIGQADKKTQSQVMSAAARGANLVVARGTA